MKEAYKEVVNGYEYTKYDGGTVTGKGYSQDTKASRDGMSKNVGGIYKLNTDDRGHVIGAQHNGPASDINLTAQNASLNRGPYRTVENAEMAITRDKDNPGSVYMEKTAYTNNANEMGSRPEAYMINDTITYNNGQVQHVNLSFANLSPQEQQMYGDIASQYNIEASNPGDELRNSMNEAEYAELMENTDNNLPNIKDEYEMWTENHYDYEAIEEANSQLLEQTNSSSNWDNVMVYDLHDGAWQPSSDYGITASTDSGISSSEVDGSSCEADDSSGDVSDSYANSGMSISD